MSKINLSILLMIAVIGLSGCSIFDKDMTYSKLAKPLLQQCFMTSVDTAVFQSQAQELLIQTDFPTNEWLVSGYGKHWSRIKKIPSGTQFRITRLIDQALGSSGRHWLVFAKFEDKTILNQSFIIPGTAHLKTGYSWISDDSNPINEKPVSFKSEFIARCR